MAECPQCSRTIELEAQACPHCQAAFTHPNGWRPMPEGPQEMARWRQLHPERTDDEVRGRKGGSLWWAFSGLLVILGAGAWYGVVAHRVFDILFTQPEQGRSGLMLGSFLIGVPLVVSLLWSALMARTRRVSFWQVLLGSSTPLLLFVFIAGAFLGEGMVCVLMALPLFLLMGLVGSVLGWASEALTRDRSPKLLGVALVLPFLFAGVEQQLPEPEAVRELTRSIHIAAPPERVWQHINFPRDIRPEELAGGWAYRMGVPYPLGAWTVEPRVGGLRELRWERGVRFQEEITAYDDGRHIAWRYLFTADSFPPGSLDDHIFIGGRYFDLRDTGYTLVPEAGGTRLDIRVGYRISTRFNWYAQPWADFLIGDTAQTILRFYKARSEAPSPAALSG